MTPEDVFAQLRDIHSPETATAVAVSFDFRPIVAFAILLTSFFIARYLFAALRARASLARIDATAEPAMQRDALIALLAASPRSPDIRSPDTRSHDIGSPPKSLFDRPEALTAADVAALRRWVRKRIR